MMKACKSTLTIILLGFLLTKSFTQDWIQSSGDQGLVVMDAEDFSDYRPGLGDKSGESFELESSEAGFFGEGYMRSFMTAGDGSIDNAENFNSKLSYAIDFNRTGKHYIWAHVFFPSPNEDSFFAGIDGKVAGQIAGSPREVWSWHKATEPLEVDSVGIHSIDIFGREPNSLIDHIIVTSNPDFDPNLDDFSLIKKIAFVKLPNKEDENGLHPDQPFIDELEGEGYEVLQVFNNALETASPSFLDTLNAVDLVIIGRSPQSSDFGGSHREAWNSIRSPLMLLQLYAARNNGLNWLPTGSASAFDQQGDTIITRIDFPDDEVFDNVDIEDDSTMAWVKTPYDYLETSDGGNGVVLAREALSRNVVFVRWDPWIEFYEGAGDMPAGYRTLIGNGNDHANATSGDPFNYYNFTKGGKQVFLNEVKRMVDLPKVPPVLADLTQIFVAPDGDDDNPGTIELPLASLQKAQQFANAGDTVYIRGGTYEPTEDDISQIVSGLFACVTYLHKSGNSEKPINYWAYPGETPVFDFSAINPQGQRVVGIYVEGNYIHLKGVEMTGIQTTITNHTESYCIYSRGSHNVYEEIVMHDNVGTGLRHFGGGGNLFLNCDAYRNWDNVSEDKTGSNNDGFGCHPSTGAEVNVFKGCRAWFNSDDGFDIIRADESVVFDSCWAFYNGYSSSFQSLGDGNGFKAGGFAYDQEHQLPEIIPRHTIRFCIAVRNKANGFYANHHLGGNDWFNNSAYSNGVDEFNMLNRPSREDADNIDGPGYDHVLKNNMSFALFGTGASNIGSELNTQENNTWNLGINVGAEDFLSVEKDQLSRPRKPDGGLPEIELLFPSRGSEIVDAGVDIGFSYKGNAPDLGAIEFDQTTSTKEVESSVVLITSMKNYPNPFGQETTIRYSLHGPGYVNIAIYDLNGYRIKNLMADQSQKTGDFEVNWQGDNDKGERCAPGVYICRMVCTNSIGKQVLVRKMVVLN